MRQRALGLVVLALAVTGCRSEPLSSARSGAPRPALPFVSDESGRTPQSEAPDGRDALLFAPLPSGLDAGTGPALDDQPLAYQVDDIAGRPAPLLEIGDPFLGPGPIAPAVMSPTGAALQPSFLLHGTYRSALQSYDDGDSTRSEWANRLDLYGDWHLSGTERVVLGWRPLDNDDGDFTGFGFHPDDSDEGWVSAANGNLTTLFFEGDFGEMFPALDPDDTRTYDWGLTAGRAPLELQGGLLLADTIDLVGVTRNSLTAPGASNLRLTGFWGWDGVNQGTDDGEDDAQILGLGGAADVSASTLQGDVLYVSDAHDDSDGWYAGAGAVQRLGGLDTTFRVVTSQAVHAESDDVRDGTLLYAEVSSTQAPADDIVYLNGFSSFGEFTSAARARDAGSPVARTGILFSPAGMGRYGAPLGGPLDDTVGFALGRQFFLDGIDEQVVVELGARDNTAGEREGMLGLGVRYQRAVGVDQVLRFDVFGAGQESAEPEKGLRIEWMLKF